MSIGLLIAGALISWVVLAFVLFGKLSDKIGFGKAHITVAVIAIAIGIALQSPEKLYAIETFHSQILKKSKMK